MKALRIHIAHATVLPFGACRESLVFSIRCQRRVSTGVVILIKVSCPISHSR
jgi:hypothetical protein